MRHINKASLFAILLLLVIPVFSIGMIAFPLGNGPDYTFGQYDMTYLPGTAESVTNMPATEIGLIPGNDSPYTVSSTVPVREGFEFIDWTLTWGTMEKPVTLTDYVVKYLSVETGRRLKRDKTVSDVPVGTTVTEYAIEIAGYTALAPTEVPRVLAESGNEIIFYYIQIEVD